MAKRLSTEDAIARVAQLRESDADAAIEGELRLLLRHRSNYVVAKAAQLAADRGLSIFAEELTTAFHFFMHDPINRDPGCSAKMEIVNALRAFGEPVWDAYLAGAAHVQKEASWGPPIDTAPTLRGMCARALLGLGHADGFRVHAVLLRDNEPAVRAIAVESLAGVPDERSELLLRAHIGYEPLHHIEMDAFEGLMRIAPDASFGFVAKFLHDDELQRVHGAALALGASHHADAFAALKTRWSDSDDETRAMLALPLALLRSDEAFDYLIGEIGDRSERLGEAIVEALALFREDAGRAHTVKRAVADRGGSRLRKRYARHFD